jgi:hypothetical protein
MISTHRVLELGEALEEGLDGAVGLGLGHPRPPQPLILLLFDGLQYPDISAHALATQRRVIIMYLTMFRLNVRRTRPWTILVAVFTSTVFIVSA